MSTETLDREHGDDRRPEVEIQRLEEMYERPSVSEVVYVSDAPDRKTAIGDVIFAPSRMRYPRQLGGLAMVRRAHVRPVLINRVGPELYHG